MGVIEFNPYMLFQRIFTSSVNALKRTETDHKDEDTLHTVKNKTWGANFKPISDAVYDLSHS